MNQILSQFESYVFDLDGTLIDSAPDVVRSLKLAYIKSGAVRDIEISDSVIGPTIDVIIDKLTPYLKPVEKAEIIDLYRSFYDSNSFENTKLYDGVEELLELLAGKRLFVVTNKPKKPTTNIINKIGLSMFEMIVCPDSIHDKMKKKEMFSYLIERAKIDPARTLSIGDAASDIINSKQNGMKTAGILGGYGSPDEIRTANPDIIIENLHELLHMFRIT